MTGTSTATRRDVIAEARRWLGTPYIHQGRLRGVGVDCGGLLAAVASSCGLTTFDVVDYERTPDGDGLTQVLLSAGCTRSMAILPGDIMVFWFNVKRHPQHVGIVSDFDGGLGLIHAFYSARAVVEHRITPGDRWFRHHSTTLMFPGMETAKWLL